ncbi:MAG: hypothetical protein NZ523_07460 [Elioraea sp.]|nr:hypothetical protein [Elioraea sp.]
MWVTDLLPPPPVAPAPPPPANARARVFVSQSNSVPPAESSWAELTKGPGLYTRADFGLPGLPVSTSAELRFDGEATAFTVLSARDTLCAACVLDEDGGDVRIANLRFVEVGLGGSRSDRVEVRDAKRGRVTTGDGDNVILIRASFRDTNLHASKDQFVIDAGAGNETIEVTGWRGVTNALIDAGAGNDRVRGTTSGDTIHGGTGNDLLWGGGGRDSFVLRQGDGQDAIMDFNAGADDRIRFEGVARSTVSWSAAVDGVTVRYGTMGDTILLAGVPFAALDWTDFSFV